MHLTQKVLVLAALGLGCAVAQPAGSLHRHLHMHKKALADVNWSAQSNYINIDWTTVNYGASSTADTPAVATTTASSTIVAAGGVQYKGSKAASSVPTSAAASSASAASSSVASPSASTSSATSSSGTGYGSPSVIYQPTGCPATGFSASKRAVSSRNVDTYVGNVGSPYGCNMKLVSSADGYTYTNTYRNNNQAPITIIIWNKSGDQSKGQGPNAGQSSLPTLGFTLAAGASQTVAFDENSQVAWSRDCTRRSDDNAPDCTWGEGDFGNVSNGGWSGYDVSSIQNSAGNNEAMCITSIAKNGGLESSNLENNWVAANQANQGAGGSIPPEANPVRLTTTFG
ncbi:hypothetical protein LPUS_09674 [Lasallia pustulata]|uniref:Allergen Asp f 4 n=1 Tax=Lasallia pustulata TaxID=136370 RepID=A0A1W5D7S6_9LECA|nr:hypothetical protein LPUS_09674 [Lasallia pustulata]